MRYLDGDWEDLDRQEIKEEGFDDSFSLNRVAEIDLLIVEAG